MTVCHTYTNVLYCQILMSVLLLVITTVILMLLVPTLLVASSVPVTRDTLEMESHAWVNTGANLKWGICIQWTEVLDWSAGLEYWNGVTGMEYTGQGFI